MTKVGILVAASALAALLAGPGTFAQTPAAEPLPVRVAVEGAYPPFNFIDQTGVFRGFEVDLMEAVCAAMRARCQIVQHEWDGIVRGLLNREYDAIMSSLEITERRLKRIAFSRPYYRIPPALIARKDSEPVAPTPEALAGRKIGAVDRSEYARYVEGVLKQSELAVYGKIEDANLDLIAGRIDAVLGDKRALAAFLESREGECCRLLADVPADPAYFGRGYAVGLRQDDTALRERFDAAIGAIIADGTYDRIRARYFSFDTK